MTIDTVVRIVSMVIMTTVAFIVSSQFFTTYTWPIIISVIIFTVSLIAAYKNKIGELWDLFLLIF